MKQRSENLLYVLFVWFFGFRVVFLTECRK